MNDLISIIVPVYNVEKYLTICIESLIKQTYRKIEIILLDDGSKDSSLQICNDYAKEDPRIVVIHQENQGPSRTRNNGLDIASGKYVMFVDSDDYIEETMIEKMVAAIETNNADLVIGGYTRFTDNSDDPRTYSKEPSAVFESKKQLALLYTKPNTNMFGISIWGKLYRNDIIQNNNIRFKPEISYEEDCQFNIDYFEHIDRTVVINEVFYHYRQMEVSLSKGYKKGTFPFLVAGYNRRIEFVKKYSPGTSLNGLHSILLIVVKNTIIKIFNSDLSVAKKIKEYKMILDFEEVQFVAKTLGKSKNDFTRLLQNLIPKRSGLLLHTALLGRDIYGKIKR